MNRKLLGMVAGTALLALQSTNASAHTNVSIGLEFGIPAPVVVTHYPVHRHAPVVVVRHVHRPHRHAFRPHRHVVRHAVRHDRRWHRVDRRYR